MFESLKRSKDDSEVSTITATPTASSSELREVDGARLTSNAPVTTGKSPELTTSESLRSHPASVGWSIFFSIGIMVSGVNAQIIGGLFATPAFQRDFGYFYKDSYIISAPWQSGIIVGLPLGMFLGASSIGYFMEKYGRKRVCLLKPCNMKLRRQPGLSDLRRRLVHFRILPIFRSLIGSFVDRRTHWGIRWWPVPDACANIYI
jgi:hypothetical protein